MSRMELEKPIGLQIALRNFCVVLASAAMIWLLVAQMSMDVGFLLHQGLSGRGRSDLRPSRPDLL